MDTDLMREVEGVDARKEKERLLAEADEQTRRFIQLAVDPYTTFGVTFSGDFVSVAEIEDEGEAKLWGAPPRDVRGRMPKARWWRLYERLLVELSRREKTGHAALFALRNHFGYSPSADDTEWALRVLHKDLRCGVSVKTVTKVFPGLVHPFAVALAHPFDAAKHTLEGPGYVEPKLDGLRVTIVDGTPYTRNGREVENLGHVLADLDGLLDDWVFDGECMGTGLFEETISKARRRGHAQATDLVYHVFDIVPREQWFQRETDVLWRRRRYLREVKETTNVRIVPAQLVQSPRPEDVYAVRDAYLDAGLEGAMWKSANARYQFKRTDLILKFKRFETEEAIIIDVKVGVGKYQGMLGAFVVQLDDGTEVDVGTGYTDLQRQEYGREMIGKVMEVKFQNRTAHGSLRFPAFVRFRPDKE